MKLDLKYHKLLYELDQNSRQPIQQIAKKIGLSKDTVNYRINKLKEAGIIKSFNAVINSGKLGMMGARILLKFYNISPKKEKEIISYMLDNPHLKWMVSVEGRWDLNTYLVYENLLELNQYYDKFLNRFRNFIEERNLSFYIKIDYFSRDYLTNNTKKTKITGFALGDKEKIDAKDELILKELTYNSRVSILELSHITKLTPKTTIKKIKNLEKKQIITGYKTEFDLEKLGYQYYKIHLTLFNSIPEEVKKLQNYLRQHKNVVYEDQMLGGYDLEFELQFKNNRELREFIDKLRQKFSSLLKDYEILHYYKEYKLKFF